MRITKVYTRSGDGGETGLVGGGRVAKDDPRVEAYGEVDELSSLIGLARAELRRAALPQGDMIDGHLEYLQHQLFDLGAILATPDDRLRAGMPELNERSAAYLESLIDGYNASLPPLTEFVLPGGSTPIAVLHTARCVARRAERRVLTLHRNEPLRGGELIYLNRLSDLLFVVARWVAQQSGAQENLWRRDLSPPPPPAATDSDEEKPD